MSQAVIINWQRDVIHGRHVLRGTVLRPNPIYGKPPLATEVCKPFLWRSGGVFGAGEKATEETYREGEPHRDPYLHLDNAMIKALQLAEMSRREAILVRLTAEWDYLLDGDAAQLIDANGELIGICSADCATGDRPAMVLLA